MADVLVVDDSAVDRRLLGGLITRASDHAVEYAANGAQALERIRAATPDLVVTDLQMPEMDGLALVVALKEELPQLPVVLVTAYGSEEIAVQALRRGAASYVPKKALAERLPDTIARLLESVPETRVLPRVFAELRSGDLRFELSNDETRFPPLVRFLQEMLSHVGVCDASASMQAGVALAEALHNAMFHGNLEVSSKLREKDVREFFAKVRERASQPPWRDRRILLDAALGPETAVLTVRDEGPGFDHRSLPDPTDPENLHRVSGRGVFLMRTFMDDVRFNDAGNEVTMTKRRAPPAAAA